ncbi:ArsA family ATPase [Desulfobacterales bacterium HSG17]|nr:ArsA family ATPase [Desulfobacterales bacterium HSG17]
MNTNNPTFCGIAFQCEDEIGGGMSIDRLLNLRQIFITGKGGVGKTTICAALGMAAAKLGKKVLIVEVGDADNIGPLFVDRTLPETPLSIQNNMWGVRVNPRMVMNEYIETHIASRFISNRITRSALFDHLAAATPGLKEVMTLGQIWRWEQHTTDDDAPPFDLIIVDSPATGHGLSLLRVPETVIQMIGVGPVAKQTQVVLDILRDPTKVAIAQVTLAEELPINEAIEFENAALTELHMAHETIFVNSVYPDIFTNDELDELENISDDNLLQMPNDFKLMIHSGKREIRRRAMQQGHVNRLRTATKSPLIEIPFFFTNEVSLIEINQIAGMFLGLMRLVENKPPTAVH